MILVQWWWSLKGASDDTSNPFVDDVHDGRAEKKRVSRGRREDALELKSAGEIPVSPRPSFLVRVTGWITRFMGEIKG